MSVESPEEDMWNTWKVGNQLDYFLFLLTCSRLCGQFVSELQTSEIPEGIMKHAVDLYILIFTTSALTGIKEAESCVLLITKQYQQNG
jgi:hypothetical protein